MIKKTPRTCPPEPGRSEEPGYFAHDDNKVARFDEYLHQPKVIDNEVFLCQSAAEPEERMHDVDLRTAPRENPQCSQPFLPRLSIVGPTDCPDLPWPHRGPDELRQPGP